MTVRAKVALAAVMSVMAVSGPGKSSVPPQQLAIELHHVAGGAYFDPAKTDPLFVLVLGSDVREGDPRGGRADSIHILAIDTRHGAGTIVGIPRDSWVPIPGSGTNKINASLTLGGPERTVATVSQLTGIRFHYWALIEFSHFRTLVDQLGGVDVRVPYAMHDVQFSGANFEAGRRHLNGPDALAFARNRHATPRGDFSRSENQGLLLLAGLAKFRRDAANPFTLAKYLTAFHNQVTTNVAPSELISLALIGRRLDPSRVRNLVLPGSGGFAGSASVVFLAPAAQDIFNRIRDDGVL